MRVNKMIAGILVFVLALSLTACGSKPAESEAAKEELTVFAAASMTETLTAAG